MKDERYWGLYYEHLYQMLVPHYRRRCRVDMGGYYLESYVCAGDEVAVTVPVPGTHKYVFTRWEYVQLLDGYQERAEV